MCAFSVYLARVSAPIQKDHGEYRWTYYFNKGDHPWHQNLNVLTAMLTESDVQRTPMEFMRLAQSMVMGAKWPLQSPRVIRLELPSAYQRKSSRLASFEGPTLLHCADRPRYPDVSSLITKARYFRPHGNRQAGRTCARNVLDELVYALGVASGSQRTFLGLASVNNKFSRMLCAGRRTTHEFPLAFQTAGPIMVLEVPDGSPLAGSVTTLDTFFELNVFDQFAHTYVSVPSGLHEPLDPCTPNLHDLHALKRL